MWCQTWNNFLVYFLSFLIFLPPLNGLYRIWKGTPKMLVRSFVFCFLFLLFNRFLFFFSIIMWQTQHNIWQTIKKTKNWPICGDSPSVFWCIGYLSNQNEILLLLFFTSLLNFIKMHPRQDTNVRGHDFVLFFKPSNSRCVVPITPPCLFPHPLHLGSLPWSPPPDCVVSFLPFSFGHTVSDYKSTYDDSFKYYIDQTELCYIHETKQKTNGFHLTGETKAADIFRSETKWSRQFRIALHLIDHMSSALISCLAACFDVITTVSSNSFNADIFAHTRFWHTDASNNSLKRFVSQHTIFGVYIWNREDSSSSSTWPISPSAFFLLYY